MKVRNKFIYIIIILTGIQACNDHRQKEKTVVGIDTTQKKSLSYDTSGTAVFLQSFRILDSAANTHPRDTFYNCCYYYVDFMESTTGIVANVEGDYAGPTGFTKADLRKWHEWFAKKYPHKNN